MPHTLDPLIPRALSNHERLASVARHYALIAVETNLDPRWKLCPRVLVGRTSKGKGPMPLKDQIKNYAKKLVENRPGSSALSGMVRVRKPLALTFRDDGIVPNNPSVPLLVYRGAVVLSTRSFDPATVIDTLFETNAWGRSWRDTVYDFVHYHSQVHEVMGVARGTARLECGGVKGRIITMKAGDVAVLPAGTGHRLIEASRDFLVVGAYPEDGTYDECTDTRDRPDAIKRIARVRKPDKDPVYGKTGPMTQLWRVARRR
jgi:uncharacterized protein YjlB